MRWNECKVSAEQVRRLAMDLGCRPILARLLLRSDPSLVEPEAARRFLEPRLRDVEDPFKIPGMDEAAARLEAAVERGERVLIFGDYDVDGITSTVAMLEFLREFGLAADFLVPRRQEEGYGLTWAAVARALDEHGRPDLFIALDCGTNSVEVVDHLREQGCDVLVIDHHQSRDGNHVECLLVNPHVTAQKDSCPWQDMCTAGLVFKCIHAVVKRMREKGRPGADRLRVAAYLDLCALGTVADLVRLSGENRVIARRGLEVLARAERPGLRALFQYAGLTPGGELEAADVSFRLGPRINAMGRLDDARVPVELLLSRDFAECLTMARSLDELNAERKKIETRIFREACAQVESLGLEDRPGILVADPRWHQGVVGIVASRLVQRYHRPFLVLGGNGSNDQMGTETTLHKGSGRSIAGVDLVSVLTLCDDFVERWGGHPMAVGLSVPVAQVAQLRDGFARAVERLYPLGLPERDLELAAWLEPEEVDETLMDILERLKPYGQGNPRPIFGLRGVRLAGSPRVMKNEHFRFAVGRNGQGALSGMAWRMAERLPPVGVELDLAVRVTWNVWKSRRTIQLELADWRMAV